MAQSNNDQIQGEIKQLRLDQLRIDGSIRCRIETPKYLLNITHYAEAMARGDKFPPIRAWYDKDKKCYWLSDGYLRLYARHTKFRGE